MFAFQYLKGVSQQGVLVKIHSKKWLNIYLFNWTIVFHLESKTHHRTAPCCGQGVGSMLCVQWGFQNNHDLWVGWPCEPDHGPVQKASVRSTSLVCCWVGRPPPPGWRAAGLHLVTVGGSLKTKLTIERCHVVDKEWLLCLCSVRFPKKVR